MPAPQTKLEVSWKLRSLSCWAFVGLEIKLGQLRTLEYGFTLGGPTLGLFDERNT